MMIPSSHALDNDTGHHMRCWIGLNFKCIPWWYLSTNALHYDSYHHQPSMMIHDDAQYHMPDMMILFITCIDTSHRQHDDTIHHKLVMMIPSHHTHWIMTPVITSVARYNFTLSPHAWHDDSLHALHDNTLHSKTPSSASPVIRHEKHAVTLL